jgi:RNA polymerase sigma factor (sigma-70 family)
MTDNQNWLAEYVQTGSDASFRELVTRYVDLVYSTALRLVGGDTHRAEDVAQTVFMNLARVARTLPKDVKLGGWLHRDTCFTASTLMRGERRRQSRERQAVEMNALQTDSGPDYSLVAPILDEAIDELGEEDRTAILLRFFEQHDFRSVGQALGSNEDAARMRVNRALDKLHDLIKRRGVTTSVAALSVVLSANAIQAAPVGLAITISTTAALTGTTVATAASTATVTTAKAIAMTATQKLLIAAIVVASVVMPVLVQHRVQTKLAEQESALRKQAALLVELQKENESLANLLAQASRSRSLPIDQFNELLRLRGQVGRLNRDVQELTRLTASGPATGSNALATTAEVWSARANQLKQWLDANPAGRIPELQFLSDQDWINSIYPNTLSSDEECRRAMSSVRVNAELRVLDVLGDALRKYGVANNGQFPHELSQLSPYFRSPIENSILERYEIVRADSLVSELQQGDEWVITQKAPIDETWDGRVTMGMTYGGMADSRVTNRWAQIR